MYGQTEASPRITTLNHSDFMKYPDSVGEVLEDGILSLDDPIKNSLGFDEGEIIYEGPNVMLGYAKSFKDLSKKQDMPNFIKTGDIGYIDNKKLFITGRAKRFAKIYGLRVNLDEMQKAIGNDFLKIAVIEEESKLVIYCEGESSIDVINKLINRVQDKFTIPINAIEVRFIENLPINSRGKISYKKLSII